MRRCDCESWEAFLDLLRESYPAFTGEWRYYRDGKSWLYKLTKKKTTISWIPAKRVLSLKFAV